MNARRFCTTIVFGLLFLCSQAGNYSISLAVNGFGGQTTYLAKIEGDLALLTDTLTADQYGMFKTEFTDDDETGFYKFIFPQLNNAEVLFIFNKENVALSTEAINPNAYTHVISSRENELYYHFITQNSIFTNQIRVLEMVYDNYLDEDFREQTANEYKKLWQRYYKELETIQKRGNDTYAWKVIKSSVPATPPILLSSTEKSGFLKTHFFDNVDFSDTTLINSEVFNTAAIQYLSVYTQNIQQSNKNSIFMSAVDSILEKASVQERTYEFMVNFLLGGFESMGATEIVTYISQKYLASNTCDNNDPHSLHRKALANTELAVGKMAPLDLLKSMDYKNDIRFDGENVAVIFWATWCSHCMDAIPHIVNHYASVKNPRYKLVTVSLDSTSTEWEKFIDQNDNFTKTKNLIDTDGWDGKLAETFHIYATPTIFMLRQGKIVAKPIEVQEFYNTLKRLEWE